MTLPCWGIDPGKTGAAALVRWARPESPSDAFDLLSAFAWTETARGVVLTSWLGEDTTLSALGLIGPVLASRGGPYAVCMEGLFVGKGHASSITLAESAGEVIAGLRAYQQGETLRPHASTWRARMLGSASLSAKAAARRAVEVAPLRVRGGLGALARNDHAADAALIACWGAVEAARKTP